MNFKFTCTAVLSLCTMALSAWDVVLPKTPSITEQTAEKELRNYLAKSTKSLKVNGKEAVFYIGNTDFARKNGIDTAKMENEAWIIKSFGNHVVITGGERGVLYGVWNFLENKIGVRWWNAFEEYVPAPADRSFKSLSESGKPFFLMREIYTGAIPPKVQITNHLRNRLNRVYQSFRIPKEYGGGDDYGMPGFVHTFNNYLWQGLFKRHPEYFALHRGVRSKQQPCLTHPEVFKIFLASLKRFVKQDEERAKKLGVKPPYRYNISMNDHWVLCQCANCVAYLKKERPSGMYIDFLNRLQREIRKERPDICLETLAYYFTEEVPINVKPDPGLIVRLCDTRSNNAFGLKHPDAAFYMNLVNKWSKTGATLSVWDYGVTFFGAYGLPLASEYGLAETMKVYADNNFKHFFWEHENTYYDFHSLKSWMEAKLLENPYLDGNKLILEFMNGYYGKAAPYLIEYRKGLNEAALKQRVSHAVYDCGPTAFTFIRPADMKRFLDLCDKAEKAVAGDAVLSRRVRFARMSLDRLVGFIRPIAYSGIGVDLDKIRENYSNTLEEYMQFVGFKNWDPKSYYGKRSVPPIRNGLNNYKTYLKYAKYTPAKTDKKIIDEFFPTDCRRLKDNTLDVVEDPKSSMNVALRLKLGKNPFPMPVAFYGYKKIGDHPGAGITPVGKNYRFYYIGTGKITDHGYLYFSKGWNMQMPMGPFGDKKVSIYASMRFDKIDGVDYMYMDRVIVTEPEKGAWMKPVQFGRGIHNDAEMLEINPKKKYRLDAEIRTVEGKPAAFIGVRMLTEPGWQTITTPSVRSMSPVLSTITAIDGNKITFAKPVPKAAKGNFLAFDAMPGFVDMPNFKTAQIKAVEKNVITVNKVPADVKVGSKVRVHGPGGYLYARKVGTNGEWSKYSITLNGISANYAGNTFWRGTRYANMILIVSGKGAVEVRNARLVEVE
ncbi:MAG: DUF4838 domain-containing protein [Lentisphaerae bacterium]|nr:DUF4838 domain-containing protein [Lentisphaerota bacterium]